MYYPPPLSFHGSPSPFTRPQRIILPIHQRPPIQRLYDFSGNRYISSAYGLCTFPSGIPFCLSGRKCLPLRVHPSSDFTRLGSLISPHLLPPPKTLPSSSLSSNGGPPCYPPWSPRALALMVNPPLPPFGFYPGLVLRNFVPLRRELRRRFQQGCLVFRALGVVSDFYSERTCLVSQV